MLDVLDVLLQLPPRAAGCEPSEAKRSEAMGWAARGQEEEKFTVFGSRNRFSVQNILKVRDVTELELDLTSWFNLVHLQTTEVTSLFRL